MTTYRTPGAWGAGKGSNLTPAEVDGNFYGHEGRIASIEQNPPHAVSIDHLTQSGAELTIWLTDGTSQGPFTLPSAQWRWTGSWKPTFLYDVNDVFSFQGGIFLVLQDHTSDVTFDPNFLVTSLPAYALLLSVPSLPYDIGLFYPLSIPNDSSILAQFDIARDATIPANFARSTAFLTIACTEPLNFPIVLNEVPIGEIQFLPGISPEAGGGPGQYGTLIMTNSGTINVTRNDIVRVLAPFVTAGADATASGLSVTISASTPGIGFGSPGTSGTRSLEDDTDVVVTSPVDGQQLTYDAASGTWKNKTGTASLAGDSDVLFSSLSDGQALVYNLSVTRWENKSLSLSLNGDVVLTSPSNGQVLKFDGSKWVNSSLAADTDTLAANSDVNITSPADKQVLVYNLSSGKWVNIALSEAYLTLADVTTLNVNATKHGLVPKAPNDDAQFLDGTGAWDNVTDADLSTSDITTNNVSTAKHGFTPKLPNDSTKFLNGVGTYTVPPGTGLGGSSSLAGDSDVSISSPADRQALIYHSSDSLWHNDSVLDSDLSTSDITTNNVTTSKHGFTPKLPNDATKFLDGTGAYSVPPGTGGGDHRLETAFSAPPTIAGGTWTTLQSPTTADITINSNTGIRISHAGEGGNVNRCVGIYKAKAGTTWTAIARIKRHLGLGNWAAYGLLLFESGSNKAEIFGITWENGLGRAKWTNVSTNTFNASENFDGNAGGSVCPFDFWVKVVRDSAPQYNYYWSMDGNAWTLVHTNSLTTVFTTEADNVGIALNSNWASTHTVTLDCYSYATSSP